MFASGIMTYTHTFDTTLIESEPFDTVVVNLLDS